MISLSCRRAEPIRMHVGCPNTLMSLRCSNTRKPRRLLWKKRTVDHRCVFVIFTGFFQTKNPHQWHPECLGTGSFTRNIFYSLLKICVLKKPIHFPVKPLAKARRIWYNHLRAPVIRLYRQCSDTSMQVCHIRCMADRLFCVSIILQKRYFVNRFGNFYLGEMKEFSKLIVFLSFLHKTDRFAGWAPLFLHCFRRACSHCGISLSLFPHSRISPVAHLLGRCPTSLSFLSAKQFFQVRRVSLLCSSFFLL